MPNLGQVVLVTGPMGSGKSTLAHNLAQRLAWESLSEDRYWIQNGWGSGLRTPEHEAVVQRQVLGDLLTVCRSGQSVVLEFILFSAPPNPLSAYETALAANGVAVEVVVLKPSVSETLIRIMGRGRPQDLQHLSERQRDVEHQVRILESDAMRSRRMIDTTGLSVDELTRTCLESLNRGPDA
jgi:predicted kinase